MRKQILQFSLLFITTIFYSQVGINTTNPQGIFNVDGAKDNPLTGTPNTAQQLNDFTVTTTGKVGIGTTSPAEALDIKGKIKLSTLGNYNSSTSIPLVWDTANQTISMGATATEKPFFTMSYVVTTAPDQDWVDNYDTKIPDSKYIVIITSAKFLKMNGVSHIRTAVVDPIKTGDPAGSTISSTPFLNVGSYSSGGTWRLQADYKDAAPGVSGIDYFWKFELMVINKNQVISWASQTGSVNSTGVGTATVSPLP